jgi:hypothetical protein
MSFSHRAEPISSLDRPIGRSASRMQANRGGRSVDLPSSLLDLRDPVFTLEDYSDFRRNGSWRQSNQWRYVLPDFQNAEGTRFVPARFHPSAAAHLYVTLPPRFGLQQLGAKLVGSDPKIDVAMIKLDDGGVRALADKPRG